MCHDMLQLITSVYTLGTFKKRKTISPTDKIKVCKTKFDLTSALTLTEQRTITYFVTGSITVRLTCLTGKYSAALLELENYKFGRTKSVKQEVSHGETFPYEISECSLKRVSETV